MSQPEIELHQAWTWDCNECGRENVARAARPSLSAEEIEELRDDHGVQPWELGDWIMAPSTVTCKFCGRSYAIVHLDDHLDD